ncbi:esterase/lipase family protein [Nitriliruptor alkaliphilus]|uniref:esterase/lipase family protein n=1 Tax=Nitriliruptor alkaliphilus TaxID=427918 RepID=UPI0006963E32|nr:alpha/beta fold hydrolase [Nitriliruptor alkaliphilus]
MEHRIARRGSSYLVAARHHLQGDRSLRGEVARLLAETPVDVDVDAHARPVVLVHGWIARKTSWARTIANLQRRGFDDLHAASYDVWREDLHRAAARVGDRLREVADRHEVDQVDVVAHSMGGPTVLAAMAADSAVADTVHRVVSLGSPWAGAPAARRARLTPVGPLRSAAQLAPGSTDLACLRAWAATRMRTPWTSVWSAADELVPGWSGTTLFGPTVTNVEAPPLGHLELLLSRRVVELIGDGLRASDAVAA